MGIFATAMGAAKVAAPHIAKWAPTIMSVLNLGKGSGPSMGEREEAMAPWKQALEQMKNRSEQYKDKGSEFWKTQENYLTNKSLQGNDWAQMLSNRQFGGMNLPSPMMAQKNLNLGLKSIQGIPDILNQAWMGQQTKADTMFSDYATGMKSYGEGLLGFQTEQGANKQSRQGDFTDIMGALQNSNAWSNLTQNWGGGGSDYDYGESYDKTNPMNRDI
jgi:hypothetical protein